MTEAAKCTALGAAVATGLAHAQSARAESSFTIAGYLGLRDAYIAPGDYSRRGRGGEDRVADDRFASPRHIAPRSLRE